MKKWMTVGALMGLAAAFCATDVRADANTSNDADSLTIIITPNVDYGVDIDTTGVTLDLGTVDLYDTAQTAEPAVVTVKGSWASQELDLSGSIEGGWSFDATPSTWATSGSQDEIAVYALFSDTALGTAPNGDDFANATADAGYTGVASRVGGDSGGGDKFEKQGANAIDMDNRAPEDDANMWIFLRLPDATSTSSDQEITLTLTAQASS